MPIDFSITIEVSTYSKAFNVWLDLGSYFNNKFIFQRAGQVILKSINILPCCEVMVAWFLA